MDSVLRDLSRLNLIFEMPIAQEKLSVSTHLKDFVHYYFTRFITNVTHAFKDFTFSEIVDFNHRHQEKLTLLVKHPSLSLEGIIVPIPKGMIQPYKQTLNDLLAILSLTHPQTIKQDLLLMSDAMNAKTIKSLKVDSYSKHDFDIAKISIGKLFGKTGLTHSTAPHVLLSKADIKYTNERLQETTIRYYPDVMSLNTILKTIESRYYATTWSETDKIILSQHFMTMAYRLSILVTIMDHVQDLEHGFVGSLDLLLKKIL